VALPDLPPFRSAVWRVLGSTLLAGTLGLTFVLSRRGSERRPVVQQGSLEGFEAGQQGGYGTLTERLGRGRFDLHYAGIEGRKTDLRLRGVDGRLEEPEASWRLLSPSAHRAQEGVWDLDGPVRIEGRDGSGAEIGNGEAGGAGPALRWEKGAWIGLAPLQWQSLEGQGRGRWTLPAGWRREGDGVLKVQQGPVAWEAPAGSQLQRMVAQRLQLSPNFEAGRLEDVEAGFSDGTVWAKRADFTRSVITWHAPIRFARQDGWMGEAEGGSAPRPPPGSALQSLEFRGFTGHRRVTEGEERAEARGARWTPAGLRLEGSVRWEQPVDGLRLRLDAPRILLREGAGEDLPADLPLHWARAEGQAVLRWGGRSLSGPSMEVNRRTRAWRIAPPVLGRSEEGTFTAGEGRGGPSSWTFDGPVTASLADGGQLRGQRLAWSGEQWILSGRPATWTRLRERLSGARLVRRGDRLTFPEGVSGALATVDGDLTLRADRGERETTQLFVEGQVEVRGRGWTLKADRVTVELAPGRVVRQVRARGRVVLEGQMGRGQGESLDLDPAGRQATWAGRVHGTGTAKPW